MAVRIYNQLGKELCQIHRASIYEDVVRSFTGEEFKNQLRDWSVKQIRDWMSKLTFLGDDYLMYADILSNEAVDGSCFMNCCDSDFKRLGFSREAIDLICLIRQGIRGLYGEGEELIPRSNINAALGLLPDYSNLPKSLANKLIDSDNNAEENGCGSLYGQFVVLGYSEYHHNGNNYEPKGCSNEKYKLKRRRIPNGYKLKRLYFQDPKVLPQHPENEELNKEGNSDKSYRIEISNVSITDSKSTQLGTGGMITFEYSSDKTMDLFQIGRLVSPEIDISLRGPVHVDKNGVVCGPVSRYSCRVLCERMHPFRCFVYSSAFDSRRKMTFPAQSCRVFCDPEDHRGSHSLSSTSEDNVNGDEGKSCEFSNTPDSELYYLRGKEFKERALRDYESRQKRMRGWDALTTYGVRLWRPDTCVWREVSVRGGLYQCPRPTPFTAGELLETPWENLMTLSSATTLTAAEKSRDRESDSTEHAELDDPRPSESEYVPNELVDGSIIDIAGVLLLFQKPSSIVKKHVVDPQQVIADLNATNPQCPVLLQSIQFEYVTLQERLERANIKNKLKTLSNGTSSNGSAYSFVSEDRRSYVFPACGHVHGYSAALEGRPCPLCRTAGPFVPIQFAFEPTLCSKRPTHVFNPCGHAASFETCQRWSSIPLPRVIPPATDFQPACPFCGIKLASMTGANASFGVGDIGGENISSVTTGGAPGPPFTKLVLQSEKGNFTDTRYEDPVNVCDDDIPKDAYDVKLKRSEDAEFIPSHESKRESDSDDESGSRGGSRAKSSAKNDHLVQVSTHEKSKRELFSREEKELVDTICHRGALDLENEKKYDGFRFDRERCLGLALTRGERLRRSPKKASVNNSNHRHEHVCLDAGDS